MNDLTWDRLLPCICGIQFANYKTSFEIVKSGKCVHFLRPPEFWGCTFEGCKFRTQYLPNIKLHEKAHGYDDGTKVIWQSEREC